MLADEEREDPVMNVPDGSYSRSASSVPGGVVSAGQAGEFDRRRWFVLGVVWLAQLMIVLDSRTPSANTPIPGIPGRPLV
jgi:hypothetical protein